MDKEGSTGDGAAPPASGRAAQRRRTRRAIVAAARRLIAAGATPSVDEIAVEADVSRRTVYLYYPTLDQLLLDATVGLLTEATIDEAVDPDRYGGDVAARVDGLARALAATAAEALPLGRKIIKLTVDAPPAPEGADPDGTARRGHRRIGWIERAVEPLRGTLDDAGMDRLVSALSIVLGWEAMIVLRDIRGLDPAREEEVLRWTARAVLDAAIRDSDPDRSEPEGRRSVHRVGRVSRPT